MSKLTQEEFNRKWHPEMNLGSGIYASYRNYKIHLSDVNGNSIKLDGDAITALEEYCTELRRDIRRVMQAGEFANDN